MHVKQVSYVYDAKGPVKVYRRATEKATLIKESSTLKWRKQRIVNSLFWHSAKWWTKLRLRHGSSRHHIFSCTAVLLRSFFPRLCSLAPIERQRSIPWWTWAQANVNHWEGLERTSVRTERGRLLLCSERCRRHWVGLVSAEYQRNVPGRNLKDCAWRLSKGRSEACGAEVIAS